MTQLHLQQPKKCLLVSSDQMQKNSLTGNMSVLSLNIIMLPQVNDIFNWQQIMQLFKESLYSREII